MTNQCSQCGNSQPTCTCTTIVMPVPRWQQGHGAPKLTGRDGDYYVDNTTGNIWQREPDRWVDTGVSFAVPPLR
jgi:hypothetical protein